MAKQSSKDALLARIDRDLDLIRKILDFFKRGTAEDAHVEETRLMAMRDYITADGEASAEVKPKRTRKRKGLPAEAPTA